jgi:5-(carboxyamino)imidazole ribonucleotide synthase
VSNGDSSAGDAAVTHPLPPGSWLGMMGGGQLGRMFCMAAQSLGYRVCVIDPGTHSPAGDVADLHLRADYLDETALAEMASLCRAVSTEFENVPAQALARLARDCRVTPGADAVSIAQDRIAEKRFIEACGVPVAPYRAVHEAADLEGIESSLLPGILKVARLGYDGKGQARVASRREALAALLEFSLASDGSAGPGGVPQRMIPCVLERRLDLAMEISVIVVRGHDGQCATFPVAENVHHDGILAVSTVPAAIDEALAAGARAAALELAARLKYVGVLCIEFFVLEDGSLLVNEMAPRPHNSGHYSIDAAVTSQFEQQARVMAGLPLGSTDLLAPAVMLNILGDAWFTTGSRQEPDWSAVLAHSGAKLHLYGKREPRPGRKMGHVTVLAGTAADARAQAMAIAPLIAQRIR